MFIYFFHECSRLTNGFCEALSKPIVREDGFLLVGTELVPDSLAPTGEKNRIFVKNFLVSSGAGVQQPRDHIPNSRRKHSDTVRLSVGGSRYAVDGLASRRFGNRQRHSNRPVRRSLYRWALQASRYVSAAQICKAPVTRMNVVYIAPINAVHADTIREVAVSPTKTSYVVSGGFDGTVVLTDLRNHGDPQAASIIGKYNASDVVSSVRWAPSIPHLSWTTDGGDFQVADTRVQSPQLQIPLYTSQNLTALGGLYTHEYLSSFNIALGFEHGHIAFVDIRMPRQNCCHTLLLGTPGDNNLALYTWDRRNATFSVGQNCDFRFWRCTSPITYDDFVRSYSMLHRQQQHTPASYKTSGDFSPERGLYLAVSDRYLRTYFIRTKAERTDPCVHMLTFTTLAWALCQYIRMTTSLARRYHLVVVLLAGNMNISVGRYDTNIRHCE
ncbi:hypothetical protein PsorP6_005317 [Peronosclerospora sorghi]|uniref:Uncharacterized protein n=1 Tax=Peronosclerospora sorghi TaxID=230839 RepID=A0ACC0W5H4_9STRA|nr:hypothetical protein PsorP6_005317 [Peronosclerospora sorghi]